MRNRIVFVVVLVMAFFVLAVAQAVAACNGLTATITGTSASETINGTSGDDVIEAGSGNDVVNGLGGNDTICGGLGNDTIAGGDGSDWMDGGNLDDTFVEGSASNGADTFVGGANTDTVDYSSRSTAVIVTMGGASANDGESGEGDNVGADVEGVKGSSAGDTITGSSNFDYITGGPGADTLDSGAGGATFLEGSATSGGDTFTGSSGSDDSVDYSSRSTAVTVTTGDATANDGQASEGDDVASSIDSVLGSSAGDAITGSGGNDLLIGNGGADTLNGGDGDDTFDEGAATNGGDSFNGGNGTDLVNYAERTAALTVTMGDSTANDGQASETDNVGSSVENLATGTANDTLTGNSGDNWIQPGRGADTVDGGDGDDTFDEGAGNTSGTGADAFTGGNGTDTVDYSSRAHAVVVTMDGASADDGKAAEGDNVGSTVENLIGTGSADTITGNAAANRITGGAGADALDGGAGDDTFYEGTASSGGDAITGGSNTDTVDYSGRTVAVTVTMDGVTANDGQSGEADNVGSTVENLLGGNGNDNVTGNSSDNAISGNGGNDTLTGASGADTLAGGDGTDTFSEGSSSNGADTFAGDNGADTVDYSGRSSAVTVTMDGASANDGESGETDNVASSVENVNGSSAADTLTGNGSANAISAGTGADTLDGGAGADTLTGGDGNDTFVEGLTSNGADVFTGGNDVDTVDYSGRSSALTVTMDGASANDGESMEGDNVGSTVENVEGSSVADTITGSSGANGIDGNGGADVLSGGSGADVLEGHAGGDVLTGGAGADEAHGGDGNDFLDLDEGTADTAASTCGNGIDYARVDATDNDTALTDCETVVDDQPADTTAPTASLGSITEASNSQYQHVSGSTVWVNPGQSGSLTVAVSASDAGSGINRVDFPALGTNWTPAGAFDDTPSPYDTTYSWTSTAANPGAQVATARDLAGNSTTVGFTVSTDAVVPANAAPLDGTAADIDWTTSTTVLDATWAGAADASAGVRDYDWCFTTNDGNDCGASGRLAQELGDTASPAQATGLTLSAGTPYFFCLRTNDNVGNSSTYACTDGQSVDATAPSNPVEADIFDLTEAGSDDLDWTSSSTALSASWAAGTDAGSGVRDYDVCFSTSSSTCSNVAGTTTQTGNTARTATATATGLSMGTTYYVCVRTYDVVGNASGWECSDGFELEIASPGPVIDGLVTDADYGSELEEYSIAWTALDPEPSELDRYEYCLGTTAEPCGEVDWTSAGTSTSVTPTGLGLEYGTVYRACVRSVDDGDHATTVPNCSDGVLLLPPWVPHQPPTRPTSVRDRVDGAGPDVDFAQTTTTISTSWYPLVATHEDRFSHWEFCAATYVDPESDECPGINDSDWVSTSATSAELPLAADGQRVFGCVRAVSDNGKRSTTSCSDGVTTDATAPTPPTTVIDGASSDIDTTVATYDFDVAWDGDADDAGSGLIGYRVEIETLDGFTVYASNLIRDLQTTELVDIGTGVVGENYVSCVVAINGAKAESRTCSDGFRIHDVMLGAAVPRPPQAVGDAVSAISATEVDDYDAARDTELAANWIEPSSSATPIDYYEVCFSEDSAGADCASMATVPWTTATVNDEFLSGVTPFGASTYLFACVRAVDTSTEVSGAVCSDGALYVDDDTIGTAEVRDGIDADVDVTSDLTSYSANWDASAEPLLATYEYCIAESVDCSTDKIVDWTESGDTSFSIANVELEDAEQYFVCVRVTDSIGDISGIECSDGATAGDTTPDVTAPAAPAHVRVDGVQRGRFVTELQPEFTWDLPESARTSDYRSYEYCVSEDDAGADCTSTAIVEWSSVEPDFTGPEPVLDPVPATAPGTLVDGSLYYVCARGYDWAGNVSASSCSKSFIPDTDEPTAPTGVQDGAAADVDATYFLGELAVNWTASTDTVSGLAGYEYCIATTTDCSTGKVRNWRAIRGKIAAPTALTARGLDLDVGEDYYVCLRATDRVGLVSPQACSDGITTVADTNAPTVGTPLDGTDETDLDAQPSVATYSASWEPGADAETRIANYDWRLCEEDDCAAIVESGATADERVTVTSLALTDTEDYFVCIRARDLSGNTSGWECSDGVTVIEDSTPPTAPAEVRDGSGADTDATDSSSSMSANWDPGSDADSGVAKYMYCIQTLGEDCNVLAWVDNGSETTMESGGLDLSNVVNYYVCVKTVDRVGLDSAPICSDSQTRHPSADEVAEERKIRESLGLNFSTSDVDAAYVDENADFKFGAMLSEAEQVELAAVQGQIDLTRSELLEYVEASQDFSGISVDMSRGVLIVLFSDNIVEHEDFIHELVTHDNRVDVSSASYSREDLENSRDLLDLEMPDLRAEYPEIISVYTDPTRNRVVLTAEEVSPSLLSDVEAFGSILEVEEGRRSYALSDDINPIRAGGKLHVFNEFGGGACTAGFNVDGPGGVFYMLTALHCGVDFSLDGEDLVIDYGTESVANYELFDGFEMPFVAEFEAPYRPDKNAITDAALYYILPESVTSDIYADGELLSVTGSRADDVTPGETVCKTNQYQQVSCGGVLAVGVDAKVCVDRSQSGDCRVSYVSKNVTEVLGFSKHGDSGGPVYFFENDRDVIAAGVLSSSSSITWEYVPVDDALRATRMLDVHTRGDLE